jgi:hypothetical protein
MLLKSSLALTSLFTSKEVLFVALVRTGRWGLIVIDGGATSQTPHFDPLSIKFRSAVHSIAGPVGCRPSFGVVAPVIFGVRSSPSGFGIEIICDDIF